MKRFLSFLVAASMLVGFAACSDDPDEPEPIPTPEQVVEEVFPEADSGSYVKNPDQPATSLEENSVTALDTFVAKYPWTISVKNTLSPAAKAALTRADEEEEYAFMLSRNENGEDPQLVLEGLGDGNPVTVYLIAPKTPTYGKGNASAEVEMTVTVAPGQEETLTIYKAYVGEVDVTFTLEAAQFDGEDFVWNEDTESDDLYVYEPVSETLNLYFANTTGQYQIPVKITVDFECAIEQAPDWLNIPTKIEKNEVYIGLWTAIPEKIENPTGEIVFVSTGEDAAKDVKLTYTVTIPNYGEVFTLYASDYKFDATGNPITSGSSMGYMAVNFMSVEGAKTYLFEKVTESVGSFYYKLMDKSWMHLNLTDTSLEDNAYIRDYRASLSVDENETFATREGIILFMPPYAFEKLGIDESAFADGLDSEAIGILSDFVFGTVAQEAKDALTISDEEREQYETEESIFFIKSASNAWFRNNYDFNGVSCFYDLVFASEWSNEAYTVFFHPDESLTNITFKYYDGNATPIEVYDDEDPAAPNWLEARALGVGIKFYMYPEYDEFESPDYAHEGFVLILSDGMPVACVHCIYDENYVSGGDNPSTPAVDSITFVHATDDEGLELAGEADIINIDKENCSVFGMDEETYLEFSGNGVKLQGLVIYGTNEVELNVPAGSQLMYMPNSIPWLKTSTEQYETVSSTLTVTVEAPAEGDPQIGQLQFTKTQSQYPDIILYCKPQLD